MKNTLKFLDNNLEKCIATVLIILMTATIFLEVIFRYCHVQAPWTEELARYMFVWMIYLGCSADVYKRQVAESHPISLGLMAFEKYVEEASDGKMQVECHYNGALGAGRELVESLMLGNMQMCEVTTSAFAGWTGEYSLLGIPYTIPSREVCLLYTSCMCFHIASASRCSFASMLCPAYALTSKIGFDRQ